MTARWAARRATSRAGAGTASRTLLLVAAVVAVLSTVIAAGTGGAEEAPPVGTESETTTSTTVGGATGDIIPRPGSGASPQEAGDRGGAGQVGVFVAICAALAVIAGLAIRDARKGRASRDPGE